MIASIDSFKMSKDQRAVWNAARSPHVFLCKTKADVEALASSNISDEYWSKLETKAQIAGKNVGQYLKDKLQEVRKAEQQKMVADITHSLFTKPDGTVRTGDEIDSYIDAVQLLQREEAERKAHQRATEALASAHKRFSNKGAE